MKKHILFLICSIILCSCNEVYDIEWFSPGLSPDSFRIEDRYRLERSLTSVPEYGLSINFRINSENCSWKFINVPDWITITPMSANNSCNVSIQVHENLTPYSRTGTFGIQIEGLPENSTGTLTVKQDAGDAYIEISKDHVNCYESKSDYLRFWCSGKKQTLIIPINTNLSDIPVSFEDCSWVTANYDKVLQSLKINVEENNTDDLRQVWFDIKLNGLNKNRVYLVQHKNGLGLKNSPYPDGNING